MDLSGDAYFDSETAADLLRLNHILEYCDSTALGSSALRRSSSVRKLYIEALSKLERVALVFDDRLYEDSVLLSPEREKKAYDKLVRRAKVVGVPESQLPPPEPREKPRQPVDSVLGTIIQVDAPSPSLAVPVTSEGRSPNRASSEERQPHHSEPSLRATPVPGSQVSLSAQDKAIEEHAVLPPSPNPSSLAPNASSSVSSLFSGTSQESTKLSKRHYIRRDSLMQYFRRGTQKRSAAATADSPRSFSSASKQHEVDSVGSEDTHGQYSAHSSSVKSPSISLRSSTSSSFDAQQSFSFRERCFLELPIKSQRFLDLQQRCRVEAQRFMTFCDHQRTALPLIFGRNRLYMAERRETDIANLQQKHETSLEALENRHLEQELAETERLRLEREESAVKNATALKHVHRRLSMLGEEATEEHLKRLDEESSAMAKLAKRHKRDIDTLIRGQKRERLLMQREHEREVVDFRKKLKQEFDDASKAKRDELQNNMSKLEDVIRDRKSRLTAKWYLELQIFKQETPDLKDYFIGPLPLRLLGLPSEFD